MPRKKYFHFTSDDSGQPLGLDSIDPAWIVDRDGIAQILKVQPRTIEHWVQNEKIPVFKLSARCQRFRVADVIRALQKFETKEADYEAR
jgi:phage terminase Nu1 subunit (DNA packaging protein)